MPGPIASTHYARYRRWRNSLRISRSSLVLIAMALVLLATPVSYRAGTEQAHPHTVFQAMIDQARGTAHMHGNDKVPTHDHAVIQRMTPAAFNLRMPLSSYVTMVSPELAIKKLVTSFWIFDHKPAAMQPDLPNLTSVQGPADLATALFALMLLLALLLAREPVRRIWFGTVHLHGVSRQILSPPPRMPLS